MKVELLSPAGSYESFLGAIHAGADAVYLGGTRFGARAYAQNFDTEELCRAIRYAHLSDRKVYLTLNTLIKEAEFSQLGEYLTPFYETGLDGIIIQDLGVFSYVREVFPMLALHVSTQMLVTGPKGADFLKKQGAVRIVPARELSLEEIKTIKKNVDIELETFIHGAMCYCYSGQCLFSSLAGGRSGNRGKCAQPCRLPYQVSVKGENLLKGEAYPLSLKDMCTIEHLPALIEAGIDSFKIEGRMKKPEYTAGVTAIYRKYIDSCYEHPEKEFQIAAEDKKRLSSLYIRSDVQNGYYDKHNGRDMITLRNPSYSVNKEEQLAEIRSQYLMPEKKIQISLSLICKVEKPLSLTLSCGTQKITEEGTVVEAADSRPVTVETIRERISRFGDTLFFVRDCSIEADENCFVPLKSLNELRRAASDRLEDAILKQKYDILNSQSMGRRYEESAPKRMSEYENSTGVSVLFSKEEQLLSCLSELPKVTRIYLETDLYLNGSFQKRFQKEVIANPQMEQIQFFLALPFILRQKDAGIFKTLTQIIGDREITGCLVRNLEELGFLNQIGYKGRIALDAGMYLFNQKALDFYKPYCDTLCLPYELNKKEKRMLSEENEHLEQLIYGRQPMMITANCIAKTCGRCPAKQKEFILTDRYKHAFPVTCLCRHCYNIIWNYVPLSLHNSLENLGRKEELLRLQFTTENGGDTKRILSFYLGTLQDGKNPGPCPIKEYTTGHEKRGVE